MKPSVKKNYFYDVFYKIFAMITPLITAPYLSRVLGASGIGIHSYTQTIVSYFALVGCLGVSAYGSREVSRNRDNKKKTTQLFYELQFVKCSVFALVIVAYVILALSSGSDSIYYLIFSLTIFANIFDITWFYSGLEKFKATSLKNTFFRVLQVLLVLTLVKGSNALTIYMFIFSGTELASALSLWLGLRRELIKVQFKELNVKQHYKETFVYFIPTIATTIYCSVDKVMLKWLVGDDSVGYYEQAKKITSLMESIVFSLNSVMTVRMSLLYRENKIDEMRDGIQKSFNFIVFLTLPMMFGISAIANKFVPLFFGPGYEEVVYLIPLMCPLVFIISISNTLGSQYLTPSGQRARSAKAIVAGMVVNIALNGALIPFWGVYGAVLASIIAEVVVTIIYLFMSKSIFKVTSILWCLTKRMIASIVMFVAVYVIGLYLPTTIWAVVVQVLIGICVYFIMLYIMLDSMLIKYTKIILSKLLKKKTNNQNHFPGIKGENSTMNTKIKLDSKFFEEEIRNDYKITTDMKKLWAVELDLLVELDRVCKKYDITYFLEGGSMLGAVRHNGFIPWDDDIDVGMTRENYNRLIQVAKTTDEFKYPYFFQHATTDVGYTRGHSQLRNSSTTGILAYELDCDIKFNQGIFIDIFVYDVVPDDLKERQKQSKILKKYKKLLYRRYNPCFIGTEKNKLKKLIKKCYKFIFSLGHTLEKDYVKIENYLTSLKDKGGNISTIFYRMDNDKHFVSSKMVEETILWEFEGFKFPVVKDYDSFLQIFFGKEYMIPKQMPTEHGGLIVDTEKDYTKYLEEYKGNNKNH